MANDGTYEKQLKDIRKLHSSGVNGDQKAVQQAHQKLAALRQAQPGNAVIEAYYGSSLALLARDTIKLLEKDELAREGLDALNRAVALDAGSKEVRLLRGNVCVRLPDSFFQTARIAIEDFTFLLHTNRASAGYLSASEVKDVLGHLIKAYESAGQPDMAKQTALQLAGLKGKG